MSKKALKILLPIVIAAAVCGAVWGGLVLYRNLSRKPVNVYSVSDFAMTDYWGDTSDAYGMVRTDNLQNVGISETQTVTEIYVEEGQEVHVGDPLVAFDTTLSDIDLQKAQISLEKLKLQYEQAQKDLVTLQNMRPYSSWIVTPESKGITYTPHETQVLLTGTGNADDPYVYLWDADDAVSAEFLKSVAALGKQSQAADSEEGADGETDTEPQEDDDPYIYCALIVRYQNALNAPITESWGLKISPDGSSFRFCDPVLSEEILAYEEEPQPYYQDNGSPYTAAELTQARADKENEIKDLELQIKMAEVELQRLQDEVDDGIVYSKLDGVVKAVRDPDECYATGESLIQVSGGGGYYIEVSMTELELDTMQLGQTVTVYSWQNGMQYEGTVVEISTSPTTDSNSWTNGNQNVSYYPFTVFVDESADMQEYSWCEVMYESSADSGNSWYLQSMMVRTEGGKSYVYVENESGKLEKRTVQTGRNLYGSYLEIRGGLSLDDYVAFPYGTDVTEGASAVEASSDELYSSYY